MPNPLRIFKKLIKGSFYNLVQKYDNRTAKVLLIYFQPLYFEMTEREQGKDNILNQNSLTTYIVSQSLVREKDINQRYAEHLTFSSPCLQ